MKKSLIHPSSNHVLSASFFPKREVGEDRGGGEVEVVRDRGGEADAAVRDEGLTPVVGVAAGRREECEGASSPVDDSSSAT